MSISYHAYQTAPKTFVDVNALPPSPPEPTHINHTLDEILPLLHLTMMMNIQIIIVHLQSKM